MLDLSRLSLHPPAPSPSARSTRTPRRSTSSVDIRDPRVLASLGPSGVRGLLLHRGKQGVPTTHPRDARGALRLDLPERPARDARALRARQEGSVGRRRRCHGRPSVDPMNPEVPLLPDGFFDFALLEAVGDSLRRPRAARALHEHRRLDALAVPARRAGRALRRRAGDRGRAVLRREALRRRRRSWTRAATSRSSTATSPRSSASSTRSTTTSSSSSTRS